jgi:hypothetical protein
MIGLASVFCGNWIIGLSLFLWLRLCRAGFFMAINGLGKGLFFYREGCEERKKVRLKKYPAAGASADGRLSGELSRDSSAWLI